MVALPNGWQYELPLPIKAVGPTGGVKMQKKREIDSRRGAVHGRRVLLGLSLLGLVGQALAQQAASPDAKETVMVTGLRASIQSSTQDKRNATGFVDTINAEDMGKFPDSNIA